MESSELRRRQGNAEYIRHRREITSAVKRKIIEVLQLEIGEEEIGFDSPLLGSGLSLDSVDAVALAAMIETSFGTQVLDSDLAMFRSVNTMVDLILTRRAGGQPDEAGPGAAAAADVTPAVPEALPAGYPSDAALRGGVGLIAAATETQLAVTGAGARAALDFVVAGNLADLALGEVLRSLILDEAGAIESIVWVARDQDGYLLLAEAGQRQAIARRLLQHRLDAEVSDQSDLYRVLIVAGPRAQDLIADLLGPDLLRLGYGQFLQREWEDMSLRVLRIGSTGELEYRLIVPAADADRALNRLHDAGSIHGLRECDSGTLTTLLMEMKSMERATMIPPGCTPREADLQWMVHGRKSAFLGRDAYLRDLHQTERRAILMVLEEGGSTAAGDGVLLAGDPAGVVQSVAYSFHLSRCIALAFIRADWAWPGLIFEVTEDAGRTARATSRSAPLFLTTSILESLNV